MTLVMTMMAHSIVTLMVIQSLKKKFLDYAYLFQITVVSICI